MTVLSNSPMSEDWNIVKTFLPSNWQDLGESCNAMIKKKSTGFGNYDNLLRTLLLHSGKGYSLTETSVRVKRSGIANVSSVSIMNALRNSEEWLRSLCHNLYSNKDIPSLACGMKMKLCDSTIVSEQGKTGSQWRIHYGISLPDFDCSHFLLTNSKGKGNGESLSKYPVEKGDCFIADRGYSRFDDISYIVKNKGDIIVRCHYRMLSFIDMKQDDFDLLTELKSLKYPGKKKEWQIYLKGKSGELIKGRLCAIRKNKIQIAKSQKKVKDKASKNSLGKVVEKEALEYAKYIVVFTTINNNIYNTEEILNWYRVRWQIELTFKRFKSLANLGCLPKYNEQSSKAWLYSKLLIALLTEKIIKYSNFSPWGYVI